jgi:signal peptidase I
MPQRGDIVVFKNPNNKSVYYVKRLIGGPGDTVQVINGDLIVNDQKLTKEKEGEYSDSRSPYVSQIDREYLNKDFSYRILDSFQSQSDNTKKFIVPEKHYFFMGDNRDNSIDSRESLGFVHEDYIIGKAEYIVFSNDYIVEPSWHIWKFFTNFKSSRFIKNLYN